MSTGPDQTYGESGTMTGLAEPRLPPRGRYRYWRLVSPKITRRRALALCIVLAFIVCLQGWLLAVLLSGHWQHLPTDRWCP
jgi:hypothetical protein